MKSGGLITSISWVITSSSCTPNTSVKLVPQPIAALLEILTTHPQSLAGCPGWYPISRSYLCRCSNILWSHLGAVKRVFLAITSRGLWSVSTNARFPYMNWSNLQQANTTYGQALQFNGHIDFVSDLDADKTVHPPCIRVAPKPSANVALNDN